MNSQLLMCDAEHFRVAYEINPYMHTTDQPDTVAAVTEHNAIVAAHLAAGRKVQWIDSAPECPDMVYTANSAVVRGNRAVLAQLPQQRSPESPYHLAWFNEHGYEILAAPYDFSGQGDALACGNLLLAAHGQRTDHRMLDVLADFLGYEVIPLKTTDTRWYDLDLAVAVVEPGRTLAYCPDALDEPSRHRLHDLGLDLITVSLGEASQFALNLISDGTTVTMSTGAPRFAAELAERGLDVVELPTAELRKGGGGIRCTALTLDNPEQQ